MALGFSKDAAAAPGIPRTKPCMGKGAIFICIGITGASRLKWCNKQGKYILIHLQFGSLSAIRNVPLFAMKKRPGEIFPAIRGFMCFRLSKEKLSLYPAVQ